MFGKIYIKHLVIFIGFLFLFITSCESDHGIAPKPILKSPPGFSGKIWFINEWPDSIKRAFLVVFKDPLRSSSDFTIFNLKFLSKEIPLGVRTHEFSSRDSAYIPVTPGPFPPDSYAYVAVVQQSTDSLSLSRKDWFVSGVYYANGNTTTPGILTIPEDTFKENINIYCDFENPPPQPPGGN